MSVSKKGKSEYSSHPPARYPEDHINAPGVIIIIIIIIRTGTGKSLSLICGSLTWLRDHKRKKFEDDINVDIAGSTS
jgi:hypothetical protein